VFVKYQIAQKPTDQNELTQPIALYFRENFDSASALTYLNELKKADYVESFKYKSKNDALKDFDRNFKREMMDVLNSNPLPASAQLFVKDEYFNQNALDTIKETLSLFTGISTVSVPDISKINRLRRTNILLQTPFILKMEL
jgi:cell division protein FtsX